MDVHALPQTFGTHLTKNGVAPRTAQAAVRHSSLDLTMNVHTEPSLFDVAVAAVIPGQVDRRCHDAYNRDTLSPS